MKYTKGRGRPSATQAARPILAGEAAIDATRLPVTCWCERLILWVPKAQLNAGRTGSCGTPLCETMDRAAA